MEQRVRLFLATFACGMQRVDRFPSKSCNLFGCTALEVAFQTEKDGSSKPSSTRNSPTTNSKRRNHSFGSCFGLCTGVCHSWREPQNWLFLKKWVPKSLNSSETTPKTSFQLRRDTYFPFAGAPWEASHQTVKRHPRPPSLRSIFWR